MYSNDPNNPEYREAYRQAERRVRAKLGFYWHFASYLIVNGLLIVIYLLTTLGAGGLYYPWFVWPMMGWGIGLLFHFLGVFAFGTMDSQSNRQKMIMEEMRRMGASYPPTGPTGGFNQPTGTEQWPPDRR
jgi:hypothetical protein